MSTNNNNNNNNNNYRFSRDSIRFKNNNKEMTIEEKTEIIRNYYKQYDIGMICENDPLLASKINIVGTTSIFEMVVKYKIRRLVFASSETVYGANQSYFCQRPINENDYSGLDQHFYTYGVMKLLNEFMADKLIISLENSNYDYIELGYVYKQDSYNGIFGGKWRNIDFTNFSLMGFLEF